MGIGDTVERALATVGLTAERVERWLGRPCGCKERREKLNRLGYWAARVLRGFTEKAAAYLEDLWES